MKELKRSESIAPGKGRGKMKGMDRKIAVAHRHDLAFVISTTAIILLVSNIEQPDISKSHQVLNAMHIPVNQMLVSEVCF